MTILSQMQTFSESFGKTIPVNSKTWRYYRLGQGSPIFWLTGGLRRAAFGFRFMQELAKCHTVLAPDYLPVMTIDEYLSAFDAILHTEKIERTVLGGQSYGGLLAQAYLAHKPQAIERLILSSTGPAGYGKTWLPVEYLFIVLARILPELAVKKMLVGGLAKIIAVPDAERNEWMDTFNTVMMTELTREDVVSHFAVAADMIRKGSENLSAFRNWTGRIIVLSAENDPTQSKSDFPKYKALFGRAVEVIDMGEMGHTAALRDPAVYVELLEKAMS